MVMTPDAAIGLASAVVAFVGFTTKVISKGNEYRKSPDGMIKENRELLAIAENLVRLSGDIRASLDVAPDVRAIPLSEAKLKTMSAAQKAAYVQKQREQAKMTLGEKNLVILTQQCQKVAGELIDILGRLTLDEHRGKVKSFRQALKTIWSKEKIAQKYASLCRVREDLLLNLIVVTSRTGLPTAKNAGKDDSHAGIAAAIRSAQPELKDQISILSANILPAASGGTEESKVLYQVRESDGVQHFFQTVNGVFEEKKVIGMTRLMVHSLDFRDREQRYQRISKAHAETFNWLFLQDHSQAQPWDDFVEWLSAKHDENGLYWITGKAGSGKSTLMRYLVDDSRTNDHLIQWASPNQIAVASCYFWNPGKEYLQRSLEGLLQTLLRDLLQQYSDLASVVSPWRWQCLEFGALSMPPWTVTELVTGFEIAIKESGKYGNVCLFIDGLDEFEGDDEARKAVVNILIQASKHPHVKVCTSSRPWRIYETSFARHPSLKLQDLTSKDIGNYVHKELISEERFQKFRTSDPDSCDQLAEEVITKAQGVFLWVYLVVQNLLTGIQNEDRIADLRRRLEDIPPRLEDYFAHMLRTLDHFYLEQAYQFFQIALQKEQCISLLTYSFAHEDKPNFAIELEVRAIDKPELSRRLDIMDRRLNTCCKGLLEVRKASGSVSFFSHTVDFLHRTVRDFLERDVLETMLDPSVAPFDVNLSLSEALLAEIKTLPFEKEDKESLFRLIDGMAEQARMYELRTQRFLPLLLDEMDRSVQLQFEKYVRFNADVSHWTYHYRVMSRDGRIDRLCPTEKNSSFLDFASYWKLDCYVGWKRIEIQKKAEAARIELEQSGVNDTTKGKSFSLRRYLKRVR